MNQNKPSGRVPSLDRHLKQQPNNRNRSRRKKNPQHDEEENAARSPVKLDQGFIRDLDLGLDELLRLPSGGESTRTFFAAVKLVTVTRPRVVILENVYGAPWDMYEDQIFPKIGYLARSMKLDSKEFYLPQTRQRGYLVALDAMSFGLAQAKEIAEEWAVRVNKCKRSPSVAVSAFLRPADDPAMIQARTDMESKSSYNPAEWALCSLRHADARNKNNIRRDDNRFSNKAMRNGRVIFCTFPLHSWQQFWRAQVARIVDLMDIAFAVSHRDGIDLGYKTGMIDVSQNVDRNSFVLSAATSTRNNLGIVGCITPSGMPVVTDQMRPVTGTETLALQGLPVDELAISIETQAQLRDLAGNAMTVPVVGAVTFGLLDAVCKISPASFTQIGLAQPKRGLYLEAPEGESLADGQANEVTSDITMLLKIAGHMVRLCHCSARANVVLKCNVCGITACSACRGSPGHDFGIKEATGFELSAEQGKVFLKNLLPIALTLPIPQDVVLHGLSAFEEEPYQSVISHILSDKPVYYFDEVKITEVVVVCYKAVDSIARLVLSPDSICHWYIYIAPWHRLRTDLAKTFDLDQPIARGQLSSDNPSIPRWAVWVPGRRNLELELVQDADGVLVASGLSFAAASSPVLDPSLHAWKNLVEEKVCGTYRHHPSCGTPGDALRVKHSSNTAYKVFMMWDSASLRDPDDDHFVWTDDVRRLEPHEYRETWLHADPTLPWKLASGLGLLTVFWLGYWSSPPQYPDAPELSRPSLIQDFVQLRWGSTRTIQQASCHTTGQAPVAGMPVLATIHATFGGFPVSAARLFKITASQTKSRFAVIPATGLEAFLNRFAFLSLTIRDSTAPVDRTQFSHLDGKWVLIAPCRDCSVTPPEITVYSKTLLRGAQKFVKAIIECPDEAALFESQYQDLPRAVAVAAQARPSNDGKPESLTVDLRLMLQPKTLASRAFAYLLQAHPTPIRGLFSLNSGAETSFTVILDYAPSPTTGFAPFRDSIRPCGDVFTAGIDLTQDGFDMPDPDPPRFCRTFTRGKKSSSVQYKLRLGQKEAVKWMLQREHTPLDFVKSEIEEEVVVPLNLRVAGKAEWTNRFPHSSRGGVVAHEIGYGKTVVTLALIDCMREFDRVESITERMEKVDDALAEELSRPFEDFADADLTYPGLKAETFFVHLSATLVIVPRHITDQWAKEAGAFLGLAPPKLLVIKTVEAFYERCSLEKLQEAEIIIVSSSVFKDGFMNRLQTVAARGPDFPKGLSGRTMEAWYRGALRNHRILTAYYLAGLSANISHDDLMETARGELLPGLIKKQQAAVAALVAKQVSQIDRSLYRKPISKAGSNEKEDGGKSEQAVEEVNNGVANMAITKKGWNISSLHNCSFARVIWDECSYDDDDQQVQLFVANTVANAKWLLSGTPKLFGLEQVCMTAAVFGVHVARPEPRMMLGLPGITTGPKLEPMSKSEEFHVFSSRVKSTTLAHERHRQAETFVAAFFRANVLEEEVGIEFEEHVQPVTMTASNAVRYLLLNQEILDSGYDYTALPAHARHQVVLKGSNLVGKDGSAAAKMLMGLVACGLGKNNESIDALRESLAGRIDTLGDQMKLLWDKTMWLWSWMRELKPEDNAETKAKFKLSEPIQDTLMRVEILCDNLGKALLGGGDFEEYGGADMFQCEAAVVAGMRYEEEGPRSAQPDLDSLRAKWDMHFYKGWEAHYNKSKALYTWLDFFAVEETTINRLTDKQLRLLAEDIFRLGYTMGLHEVPFNGSRPNVDFLQQALAPGSQAASRNIPADLEERVANGARALDGLIDALGIEDFILACANEKPTIKTWKEAKASNYKAELNLEGGKQVKAALQERLAELNLKYASSHNTDKLREVLWRHETGISVCEHYRDGRAPPDRYRDLESAIWCGGTILKQMEATNEELKRTMVHLAKTVEDLRATRLEANFVPEYASLANARDVNRIVENKVCGGCRQPLKAASSSFLVVACGHFLCSECRPAASFYCPVKDCPAFIRERPVLRCSQVPRTSGAADEPRTKAECVADLIKRGIPRDDHVVVFAQYPPLVDALEKAFKAAGLKCLNLAAMKDDAISKKLEDFKAGKAGQVLLLDMDSETSAGSNLTIATHVIFANPYVHHDEEHQARTVRQARGRCIRTGQTKKVHVYHFMVSGTIEEESLRKFGEDSPGVREFFENYDRVPWWLDDHEAGDGAEVVVSAE